MQKLSGLRSLEGFRSLVGSTSTGMKAANPKPFSDAGGSSYGSVANLKITAEKLVKEQASVKTDLEMAHTKLRRATEQISLLEGKLQQAVNENAKLKVKQNEDSKLWQGLDSKISSTKTLCDQLTETLQQLASQTEQAEEDKKFFEGMLGKNSKAVDEFNCLLHDLSTKLECAEQKIISEKLVKKQASVKTDLEMAHTKLRRATEQISLLEGKLQEPVNENAKLKVKQNEDSKLWQGLDSKISSTKTLCDQLTETLQQLASQTEQAEEDRKFFEGMLGKNSKALDEFNCLLHDLSTKLECAEQKIISGKQEMLQNSEEKEGIDRSYEELYSNAMIKEKDSLINQLEGSVDEIKSLSQLMEQELKLKDDVCISLNENVAGSANEQNNLDIRNQGWTLETEKLCKDNKDLNKFLGSFMAKVTELDKEHASMPSHVSMSRLLCSFVFHEMVQEKTKHQLNKEKDQYDLMIEGKQLDLQKYLKDLSLKNELVITCVCKKYELDGIEITSDEMKKPEKFSRQIENNCNEMHYKGAHGKMVERIQQDNEYKESRLWTYHKEELQRIRSYIENGLRVMFSLLKKHHEAHKDTFRMRHVEECHIIQEELDNDKSKEYFASLMKRRDPYKIKNHQLKLASPETKKKAAHTRKGNSKRRKDQPDQNYPGNTATVILDRENWEASQHSFKRGIRKARAWCRANSKPVDLSDHFEGGAEVYTTPARGTFHLTFEYNKRRLTLFIYGRVLYVKGWHSQRSGTFQIEKNFIPDPTCTFLDTGVNYNELCKGRHVGNVRIGLEPLIESFEILDKCKGVATPDVVRAIAVFAVGGPEAIRLQDIFEAYMDSFDPITCWYQVGEVLSFWIKNYDHYSGEYLTWLNCALDGKPIPAIENRKEGKVKCINELRQRIRVPLRDSCKVGTFKDADDEKEDPPTWSPPYEDGKDWDATQLDNDDIKYWPTDEGGECGNCTYEEDEYESKNLTSEEKEMHEDDEKSTYRAEKELTEDDDGLEDIRVRRSYLNTIRGHYPVVRSSIFRFATAVASSSMDTVGKPGLIAAIASGGMTTKTHHHAFPTPLVRINSSELWRSSWHVQRLSGWRKVQSMTRFLQRIF